MKRNNYWENLNYYIVAKGSTSKDDQTPQQGFKASTKTLDNPVTEGHFQPLKQRISRIQTSLDSIIAHQEFEREKA